MLVAVLAAGQVGLLGGGVERQRWPVVRGRDRDAPTDRDRRRDRRRQPFPDSEPRHPRRRPRPPSSPTSRSSRSPTSGRRRPRPSAKELKAVLAGTSDRYTALELVESEADAILSALGADRPSDPARLVLAPDATTLAADLAKNRKRLAFLRADAVGPEVRALAWGDAALFGVDRVKTSRTGR